MRGAAGVSLIVSVPVPTDAGRTAGVPRRAWSVSDAADECEALGSLETSTKDDVFTTRISVRVNAEGLLDASGLS
jgi:hypothetical protein